MGAPRGGRVGRERGPGGERVWRVERGRVWERRATGQAVNRSNPLFRVVRRNVGQSGWDRASDLPSSSPA